MTEKARKALLLALLAATVLAAFWPQPEDQETELNWPRQKMDMSGRNSPVPSSTWVDTAPPSRMGALPPIVDLFAVQKETVVTAPARPSVPEPPPMPFVYVGRYQDEGGIMVFLMEGDSMYVVKLGDTLPGGWKVTEIAPTDLKLLFVPMNVTRTLPMSDLQQ